MRIDPGWEQAGFSDRLLGEIVDTFMIVLMAVLGHMILGRGALALALAWFMWNSTYTVGRTGQSLGGRLANVKVVDDDGRAIGVWRALGRNLFAIFISGPFFYLGFLWVIWDRQKQAWHDSIFRTHVIRRVAG
jgi:uncharacterized RDD family membrane protein YckC